MMASNDTPLLDSEPEDLLNREEFSDFAIVVENGQEVKCHKVMLAKASPVFRAMLKKDFLETKTNKMQMTEFDSETVQSFLDYIYEDHELVPDQDVYKRNFDKKRLTAELLRFSHMYDVRNLLKKCIEHQKKNVDDTNAVQVWTVAEAIGNEELREVALEYLTKKKDKLLEVPGMRESFLSPQLMESLVDYLMCRPTQIVTNPSASTITVTVRCIYEDSRNLHSIHGIEVENSHSVMILRALTDQKLMRDGLGRWQCNVDSFRRQDSSGNFSVVLHEHKTLRSYNLQNQSTVRCTVFKEDY